MDVDDLVLTRVDNDADGDYLDRVEAPHFALTDHQFSVIAMISDIGTLERRVTYTPYGEARHHWYNDVDGDGDVDAADTTAAGNANGKNVYESGYNVDADFNRDGVVNSTDTAQVTSSSYKGALPGGWIAPLAGTGKGVVHERLPVPRWTI